MVGQHFNAGGGNRFSLGQQVLFKHHYHGQDYQLKARIVVHEDAPDGYHESTGLYSLAIQEKGGKFYSGAETWAYPSEIEEYSERPSLNSALNKRARLIPR